MSIRLGGNILQYKTNKNKYIITFLSDYNEHINTYLDIISNSFFPFYNSRKLSYSNVCGDNVEFICKNLKINGISFGKIIITNWLEVNSQNLQTITSVYGPIYLTIGASYHALVYFEINIQDKTYYVAIETTICEPYKLQFYVGNNKEVFETIIKTRYQCRDFKISFDSEKMWFDIAYK